MTANSVTDKRSLRPPVDRAERCRISKAGDRLAFSIPDGEKHPAGIYVWEIGSPEVRCIARAESFRPDDLVWSPDGAHVAYVKGGGPPGALAAEVGWASALVEGELGHTAGAVALWTARGNALLTVDPARKALFRQPLTGSVAQKLADVNDDGDPQNLPKIALSGDGGLVSVTCRRVREDLSEVWILGRTEQGITMTLLTQIPGSSVVVQPIWAPRSPTIALHIAHLAQEKSAWIAVPRLEGEGVVLREVDLIEPGVRPAWGPSAETLCFFGADKARHEFTRSGAPRLFLMNELGSGAPVLTGVTGPDELLGDLVTLGDRALAVESDDHVDVLTFAEPL